MMKKMRSIFSSLSFYRNVDTRTYGQSGGMLMKTSLLDMFLVMSGDAAANLANFFIFFFFSFCRYPY